MNEQWIYPSYRIFSLTAQRVQYLHVEKKNSTGTTIIQSSVIDPYVETVKVRLEV